MRNVACKFNKEKMSYSKNCLKNQEKQSQNFI